MAGRFSFGPVLEGFGDDRALEMADNTLARIGPGRGYLGGRCMYATDRRWNPPFRKDAYDQARPLYALAGSGRGVPFYERFASDLAASY